MEEMPAQAVAALQVWRADHRISERHARWWGYLRMARTDASERTRFTFSTSGSDEEAACDFVAYTLSVRLSAEWAALT